MLAVWKPTLHSQFSCIAKHKDRIATSSVLELQFQVQCCLHLFCFSIYECVLSTCPVWQVNRCLWGLTVFPMDSNLQQASEGLVLSI